MMNVQVFQDVVNTAFLPPGLALLLLFTFCRISAVRFSVPGLFFPGCAGSVFLISRAGTGLLLLFGLRLILSAFVPVILKFPALFTAGTVKVCIPEVELFRDVPDCMLLLFQDTACFRELFLLFEHDRDQLLLIHGFQLAFFVPAEPESGDMGRILFLLCPCIHFSGCHRDAPHLSMLRIFSSLWSACFRDAFNSESSDRSAWMSCSFCRSCSFASS